MRKQVSKFSLSLFVFFIFIILSSLIIALLAFKGLLVGKATFITTSLVSLVGFFLLGLVYGYKRKKRGLISGLILSSFYILFLLLYYGLGNIHVTLSSILIDSSRVILLIVGSIIGVNKGSNKLK